LTQTWTNPYGFGSGKHGAITRNISEWHFPLLATLPRRRFRSRWL
jgi:hypothetical protein